MILGVVGSRQSFRDWVVTSTYAFTKTENKKNKMLLTSAFNSIGLSNTNWLEALTTRHFGNSTIGLNFTNTNSIGSNPSNNGLTHRVYANCYDSGDNFLGAVGFGYTFAITATYKAAVYLIKDMRAVGGGFTDVELSSILNVPSFNAADIFNLSVNPSTLAWNVSKEGYKAEGGDLIGLMPSGTAYVRYYSLFNIGAGMTGTAELSVISID